MEYAINIKETLSRTIIVEADDLCEALQNVEDAANEGKINLTCDDSFDRDITPAEWAHEGVIPDGSNTDYYEHLYKSTSIEYLYADVQIIRHLIKSLYLADIQQSRLTLLLNA